MDANMLLQAFKDLKRPHISHEILYVLIQKVCEMVLAKHLLLETHINCAFVNNAETSVQITLLG